MGSLKKGNIALPIMLLALTLICACGGPEAKVAEVLNKRTKAFEKMDLNSYMSVISKQYSDDRHTYETLQNKMEKLFSGLDGIKFEVRERELTVSSKENHAFAKQICFVEFTLPSGIVKSGVGEEHIYLKRENGNWKIVSGLIQGLPKQSSQFGNIIPLLDLDFLISKGPCKEIFTIN